MGVKILLVVSTNLPLYRKVCGNIFQMANGISHYVIWWTQKECTVWFGWVQSDLQNLIVSKYYVHHISKWLMMFIQY